MKKIFLYMFVVSALLAGCSNMLDEDTSSFLSTDVIYASNLGTEAALAGAYSGLGGYEYFPSGYSNLVSASSGVMFTRHAASKDLLTVTALPTNKYLNDCYSDIYTAINRANDVIFNVREGGADDDVKDRVEGEARFIRSVSYFNLVRLIGGVPLRVVPTTATTLHLPRASKEEVYAQIIEDLELAIEYLPEENPVKGRPSKYAAHALLAKVYLTLADGVEGSDYWRKALEHGKAVYGKYELVPLDVLYNVANKNTAESIFEVQLSVESGRGNYWTRMIAPSNSVHTPNATSNPYGRMRPTKYMFDSFMAQYPGDPRIDATFIYGSYTQRNGSKDVKTYPQFASKPSEKEFFPYLKKFIDSEYTASGSNANFIYLRYADVLLLTAEAENEVNGPAEAYKYVNEVLKRARESVDPPSVEPADWSGMTKEEFRSRIMMERLFELYGEQHEFYEVRRRGIQYLIDYFKAHNSHPENRFETNDVDYNDVEYPTTEDFAKRALLLPFPSSEINSNQAISDEDQNYGY